MTFTVVGPGGDEYGLDSLEVFRDVYKPQGYLIARQQPAYSEWGVPDGAKDDELTPDPNGKPKRSQRAATGATESASDAA